MNRIDFGDCRETMRRWAAEGVRVQCIATSPPYWNLRDYGHAEQLGTESTPDAYVANLVEVFRCAWAVLADDGVLFLNLGDSYSGDRGRGSSSARSLCDSRRRDNTPIPRSDMRVPGLQVKELVGIPWRVAFALQADGWYLRQDIIWHKPNPMPESVTDRCTKAHEYVFLLSKRERYYFDAEAIKEAAAWPGGPGNVRPVRAVPGQVEGNGSTRGGLHKIGASDTKNRRSVWTIPTRPYKGAHFATFPPALVEPCILAGTSERGHCPACGARRTRVTRPALDVGHTGTTDSAYAEGSTANRLALLRQAARAQGVEYTGARITVGWVAGCACGLAPVPDVVLDPFMGSGTTAMVAKQHGRHYAGCELNPDFANLQAERIDSVAEPGPVASVTAVRAPRSAHQLGLFAEAAA